MWRGANYSRASSQPDGVMWSGEGSEGSKVAHDGIMTCLRE